MPAVPRTAPTGAPSATAPAQPVLTESGPLTATARRYVVAADGVVVPAVQAHTPSANAVYTGQTAIDRTSYIGQQLATATGSDPALATSVVREYRDRAGTYPDLTQFGALGSGYTGGALIPGEQPLQQASILGGLTPTMLIVLGAAALVAVVLFGRKRR